jgi:hypothetical protein
MLQKNKYAEKEGKAMMFFDIMTAKNLPLTSAYAFAGLVAAAFFICYFFV